MSDFFAFLSERHEQILSLVWEHCYISLLAVLAGFILSVPLGILLTRAERISQYVIGVVNILQTIPSLALLGFMIPFLGIGAFPAVVALFLYSLLPMLRNTYTGIREVEPSLIEAARGMGMTNLQILFKVEIPLAISIIMGGLRTATIYTISWATLAAVVGGGGLGYLVFTGLGNSNDNMLLTGALLTALLAAFADLVTRKFQRMCTPRGLRK
ncbi:ABC transporter permease [Brevibacillus agri]|uniref:ABC transporter permease n=1 Tax=Brevibacillus TaxID=55080 RepID=UPI0002717690|nr:MULTISPECIES: ABC transporter permease [Brevibacillus]EJL42726.1 ABC-type proline/glycine betaine transport system, permease component [Brevibacillus sp. CF112]MBG9566493.1 choline ABC transporter permease [Brevibacillus agri]MCG5254455.1 ABC transporter permease [Brevibacillus agri]MDN4093383.1 ABC transporter permease [Brevibacillus agri]MDR9507189.1 ABC transporter permease [Brevibacillus agri]